MASRMTGAKLVVACAGVAALAAAVFCFGQGSHPKHAKSWHEFDKNVTSGWRAADAQRKKKEFDQAAETYQKVIDYINKEEVGRIPHMVVCESMITLCKAMPVDLTELTDGEYEGTSRGYAADIVMKVTIAEGKISTLQVKEQKESRPGKALAAVPALIVKKQTPSVDAVTGATVTSYATMCAVQNALSKAPKKEAAKTE